jgi:hypothetical protein
MQVISCTLQSLLLAAAASNFAAKYHHVVARSFGASFGLVFMHSDASADHHLPLSHMSASARLLISEQTMMCAAASQTLCQAWAVAAVPLLLSQVIM